MSHEKFDVQTYILTTTHMFYTKDDNVLFAPRVQFFTDRDAAYRIMKADRIQTVSRAAIDYGEIKLRKEPLYKDGSQIDITLPDGTTHVYAWSLYRRTIDETEAVMTWEDGDPDPV